MNKGYDSCDPLSRLMDIENSSPFMLKRGTGETDISRQNLEELKATLKQLRAIRRKEGI